MSHLQSRHAVRDGAIQVTTSTDSRTGTLAFDGDFATLTFERRLRHPARVVWEAITDPHHLARWYMTSARLEGREGGNIEFVTGSAQVRATGKILIWDPPRVFEHEWNVGPRKDLPKGEKTIVRWDLTPEGDHTFLRFTHRRLTRQTATNFAGGMHGFLDRLEEQLDGVPLVDWITRINEVRGKYPPSGT